MKSIEKLSPEAREEIELYEASQWALDKIKNEPLYWLRKYTATFDQQFEEAQLSSATNPFPDHYYLDVVFDFLERKPKLVPTSNTKVRLLPKSRKLLISWAIMGKLTHLAETKAYQEIVVQSKQEIMGCYMVDYAKTLWRNQPEWLRAQFPLKKGMKVDDFARDTLEFENGSVIMAIPQGEAKLNTLHPSVHFMDEASFHEEGLGAYNSAMAAASFIIAVSSAFPSWFHDLIGEDRYPRNAKQIAPGIAFTQTKRGSPVLWVHYSCHPDRGAEWVEHEKPNYTSNAEWNRQQEIDFTAGGGEKVLRDRLEARWDEIVITEENSPGWRPHSEWNYDAGFDFGKTHPAAFEVIAKDFDGCLYAVQEHYQSGLTPGETAEIVRQMRVPCGGDPLTVSKITRTWADPSLFPDTQANDERFTSFQELLEREGSLKLCKALRGMDLFVLNMIEEMWPKKGPIRFKIWCPQPVLRKTEGTFQQGCPNLLWELMNLRRKEISPTMLEKKGSPEGLVDNRNDAFDALKYLLTAGGPADYVETSDQKWKARVSILKEKNPDIDIHSLIILKGKFDRDQKKVQEKSWR